MRKILPVIAIALMSSVSVFGDGPGIQPAAPTALESPDPYTLVGPENYLTGYAPLNDDGTVNVVVEIPAGTTAKWEVDKQDGAIKWEFKKGKPRVVEYLGYPGNYGMVPGTLLPRELGGDGDPLDVIVLGPAVARGSVVRARILGVLKLLDGGEKDDKLLAVTPRTALVRATSLAELDSRFPGVTTIVETWFVHYKGPGKMESLGFGEADEARKTLEAAITAFRTRHGDPRTNTGTETPVRHERAAAEPRRLAR